MQMFKLLSFCSSSSELVSAPFTSFSCISSNTIPDDHNRTCTHTRIQPSHRSRTHKTMTSPPDSFNTSKFPYTSSSCSSSSSERGISPFSPRHPAEPPKTKFHSVKRFWKNYRERRRARESTTSGRDHTLRSLLGRSQQQCPFTALDNVGLKISLDVAEDEKDEFDMRFLDNPIGIGCSKFFEKTDSDESANTDSSSPSHSSSVSRCSSAELMFCMIDPFEIEPAERVLVRVRSLDECWSPLKNKGRMRPVSY